MRIFLNTILVGMEFFVLFVLMMMLDYQHPLSLIASGFIFSTFVLMLGVIAIVNALYSVSNSVKGSKL